MNVECLDFVDIFNLFGIGGHLAPIVHGEQDWRGRIDHEPLLVCIGRLPRPLHIKLVLQILHRGIL